MKLAALTSGTQQLAACFTQISSSTMSALSFEASASAPGSASLLSRDAPEPLVGTHEHYNGEKVVFVISCLMERVPVGGAGLQPVPPLTYLLPTFTRFSGLRIGSESAWRTKW